MAASDRMDSVQGGLSDEEKRDNVIRLAFGDDPARLREFCRVVEEVIPPGTTVVLRGSSLTGRRWDHTQPFGSLALHGLHAESTIDAGSGVWLS